jgi:GH24 family phage-related lysozyme (muramidase)
MNARYPAALLAASAALVVAIAINEGYAPTVVSTKADPVPTGGFGSTLDEEGWPLKIGEAMPPVRALVVLQAHLSREESAFRKTLGGVALWQGEYDLYFEWAYQYGLARWRGSTMLRELKAGRYRAACDALLLYKYSHGQDCTKPQNRTCRGVWDRNLKRHAACLALLGEGG